MGMRAWRDTPGGSGSLWAGFTLGRVHSGQGSLWAGVTLSGGHSGQGVTRGGLAAFGRSFLAFPTSTSRSLFRRGRLKRRGQQTCSAHPPEPPKPIRCQARPQPPTSQFCDIEEHGEGPTSAVAGPRHAPHP